MWPLPPLPAICLQCALGLPDNLLPYYHVRQDGQAGFGHSSRQSSFDAPETDSGGCKQGYSHESHARYASSLTKSRAPCKPEPFLPMAQLLLGSVAFIPVCLALKHGTAPRCESVCPSQCYPSLLLSLSLEFASSTALFCWSSGLHQRQTQSRPSDHPDKPQALDPRPLPIHTKEASSCQGGQVKVGGSLFPSL